MRMEAKIFCISESKCALSSGTRTHKKVGAYGGRFPLCASEFGTPTFPKLVRQGKADHGRDTFNLFGTLCYTYKRHPPSSYGFPAPPPFVQISFPQKKGCSGTRPRTKGVAGISPVSAASGM